MKIDDDALLSAYVDGALDGPELQRVEAAIRTNPRIAREVDALRQTRDLLAGLPAPLPPRSCVPTVRFKLAEMSRRALRAQRQTRVAMLWVSVGVIAACFMLAWSLHLLHLSQSFRRSSPYWRASEIARIDPPAAPTNSGPQPAEVALNEPSVELPSVEVPVPTPEAIARKQLRDLLGLSVPVRLLVQLNDQAAGSIDELDRIIHEVPRANPLHARLSLPGRLVIDPVHPGSAVVYAVALDDFEFANLLERIRRATGVGSVEEADTTFATMALLAEATDLTFGEVGPSGSVIRPEQRPITHLTDSFAMLREDRASASSSPSAPRLTLGPPSALTRRDSAGTPTDRVSREVPTRELGQLLARLDRAGARILEDAPLPSQVERRLRLIWIVGASTGD